MLGFWTKINLKIGFSGVFSVCKFCHSALQSFKCVCVTVEHEHKLCAYIKLTFHLHHARHNCSVSIHCTLVRLYCCKTYLESLPDPIMALINSPVFTPPEYGPVGATVAWTQPYPKCYGHASNLRIPGLYLSKVLTSCIKMADHHNVK